MYSLSAIRAEKDLQEKFDTDEPINIEDVISVITYWLSPEEVFDYETLQKWAEEHGFSKAEWRINPYR